MAKIACIGHTTLDLIFLLEEGHLQKIDIGLTELCLPFPSKISAQTKVVTLGGNAPNAGAGLKITGHEVVLISQLGQDQIGQIILGELEKWNFDLSHVTQEAESDTSVILSYKGDRTIVAYHSSIPYQFPDDLTQVDWIYLSSLGFADFKPLHGKILEYLQGHPEVELVYNPGRPEIEAGFASIQETLLVAHTVILNKEEAQEILNYFPSGSHPYELEKALLKQFIEKGVKRIIITDGKSGSYYAENKTEFYRMPAMSGEAVDTTGAGDSFSSGYLSGLVHGRGPLEAIRLGTAQSAQNVTVPGATTGLLTLEELDEILNSNSDQVPQRF